MNCPKCQHHVTNHNTGRCTVLKIATVEGLTDYGPDGCGCTAMPFDMVCTTCGRDFVCGQVSSHQPHDCLSCHEAKRHDADATSFGPLIDALQRRNIPVSDADIWNTGGHVMCLGLHLTEDPKGPYAMWSDGAEYIGFGVYPDSEHTGFFVSPADGDPDRPDEAYSWAYADNAERAADLAAQAIPQVVAWLDGQTFTSRTSEFMGEAYEVREIVRPYSPLVVTGAEVEDFEAPR